MKGRGVAQAAHGHGGAWHDLFAARDNRGVEHPKQLIGVAVRMATGTGESGSGGGLGGVESNAATLEIRMRGIMQRDGRLGLGRGAVSDIDDGHCVSHSVENPCVIFV